MENPNFKVPYTKIVKLEPHSNAEKLELAFVYDFQVVVQKGRYQAGDSVIYIPIDSILPEKVEVILFGPDAKVKLHHSRVSQIRLRG
jgi:RNA ligase (TIGR02306 family)